MKTLTELRQMIANAKANNADSLLEICDEIVKNLQRVERKLNRERRTAERPVYGGGHE